MKKNNFNLDKTVDEMRNAPALGFISSAEPEPEPATETKSRRVQMLLKPSLYKELKKEADKERRSLNDYLNIILEDLVNEKRMKEGDDLGKN